MTNVFTYGSLMYPAVWDQVAKGRYAGTTARVHGYRRHVVRDESYPAAVPAARAWEPEVAAREAVIVGRMYCGVSADDVMRLDAFETSDYERATVDVELLQAVVLPGGARLEAGVSVAADLYVYRFVERLAARDWDPAWFEREGIHHFIATYCARHGSG